jgi:hypothetical protein
MEPGLQFDWEQSSEAIALISLAEQEESSFSLLQNLISEASAKYPQLSQLHFVNVPLPIAKLKSWSYCLAGQMVAQWRELPLPKYSVEVIVNELGLSQAENREPFFAALDKTAIATPLSLQLAKRIQLLKQQCQHQQKLPPSEQQQCLEQEVAKLAEWFTDLSATSPTAASSCLTQLQSNVIALRSQIIGQLQSYFNQMQQVGTRSLLVWLDSLIETFDGIRANYEKQRQDSLRRESSAWRAYYNLNPQLEERNWKLFSRHRPDWQAVLSALATAYNSKLKAEIYTQSAQLVGELVQQTRLYADSVKQNDSLLARLQNYFSDCSSVESLFLPLLKNFLAERVNTVQMRDEIETWADCKCDRWHTLDSSQTTALCEQILIRIRPLCLEVYAECCRCVLNLEDPNCQDQPAMKAQTPAPPEPKLSDAEKRVSLQVQNADIQDVLELVAKKGCVCVVVDKSIGGTVSLSLDEVPLTEALAAVAAAGNLTYTKNSNIYTFKRRLDKNSPPTIISENSNIYTFNRSE